MGAKRVVLTDEFLSIAVVNAAAYSATSTSQTTVDVRRVRWGDADDADDVEPDDATSLELVVGAELTPMIPGHAALAAEIAHRLALAKRRGSQAKGILALSPCDVAHATTCACAPRRCPTHKFLDVAARAGLDRTRLLFDVPASKADDSDVTGLDLTFDDDADVIWVVEFDAGPPSTPPAAHEGRPT